VLKVLKVLKDKEVFLEHKEPQEILVHKVPKDK
jgi:hypothetical protein